MEIRNLRSSGPEPAAGSPRPLKVWRCCPGGTGHSETSNMRAWPTPARNRLPEETAAAQTKGKQRLVGVGGDSMCKGTGVGRSTDASRDFNHPWGTGNQGERPRNEPVVEGICWSYQGCGILQRKPGRHFNDTDLSCVQCFGFACMTTRGDIWHIAVKDEELESPIQLRGLAFHCQLCDLLSPFLAHSASKP